MEYAGDAGDAGCRRDAQGLSELNLDEVLPGSHTPCTPDKQGAADPSSLRENRRAARFLDKGVVEKRQEVYAF